MIIQKIRVDGYKNIFNTAINFEDITALVGLNNYGKSNVLEAMEFGKNFIKNPYQIKSKMMKRKRFIPINIKTANRDFCFEIEYLTTFNESQVYVNYEFKFTWPKDKGDGCKIVKEVLKIKENKKNQQFNTFIRRDNEKAFYKSSDTGRCNKEIKIEDNNLVINKLINFDDLFYLDLIKELNNLNFDLNSFLDAKDAFNILPIERKGINLYELDKDLGINIAKVIFNLKNNYEDKYELLIDSFKSLFPNIEDIKTVNFSVDKELEDKVDNNRLERVPFKIADEVYYILVKERYNNQPTEFKMLSNGTKRIFLLLTAAVLADINHISLIAFEELENCIHPHLFQQLLMILSSLIENCRIIITSHSPYLIQYLDLEKIYIGIPSYDGTAIFKKIKKSKKRTIYNDANDFNMSIGDYIFYLLIESYDDNEELCSFLECE